MRGSGFAAATLIATARPAAAHSPLPGIDGFYAGLWHPFTTPEQLIALVGTGLLLGGYPIARLRPAFLALGTGLAVGLASGATARDPAIWLYGVAAIAAGLAALAPGRWLPVAVLLCGAAGVLLGWASLPEPGPPRDRMFTMAGSASGTALVLLFVAGTIDLLRQRFPDAWFGIVLRVLGAWTGAVATMMLALGSV